MKLSERLNAAAAMIPYGARFADIGTDHGYIPVWLALRGDAERIVASDIKPGPLAAAKQSAEKYGVSDKIEFVLADGLDGIKGGVDTVLMAGMGGETIMQRLGNAGWLRDEGVLLILQPQSKLWELSAWLSENGYVISDASLVSDAGRIYTVMKVTAGENGNIHTTELSVLDLLSEKRDPLLPEYVERLVEKYRKMLEGISSGSDRELLMKTEDMAARLENLKKETEKW